MRLTSETFNRVARAALFGVAVLAATSCGEVARTGQSPVYLVIDTLEGASGASPNTFGTILSSDVLTLVGSGQTRTPTIFSDLGRVNLRLGLRNPGSPGSPNAPSPLNDVTITRYRVTYRRADGRNTQGVDIPWGFDGAFTLTVPGERVGLGRLRSRADSGQARTAAQQPCERRRAERHQHHR